MDRGWFDGKAIAMGFFDTLLGNDAADAAKSAAQDTYSKQSKAIDSLLNYGNTYAQNFQNLGQGYQPWIDTGKTANGSLQTLLNDPSSVRSLPGYQFAMDQGLQSVDRGAAARSGVQNGATIKAEQRFGTGLADQTYGNQIQRLLGISGQGLGALGSQNTTTGQGLQGQLQTQLAGYNGGMQSAGTIGQGDIAGANAQASGIQNLMNFGGNLLGKAIGATNPLGALMGGGGSSFAYGSPGYYGGSPSNNPNLAPF